MNFATKIGQKEMDVVHISASVPLHMKLKKNAHGPHPIQGPQSKDSGGGNPGRSRNPLPQQTL